MAKVIERGSVTEYHSPSILAIGESFWADLKSIDDGYFVVRNHIEARWEIHNKYQPFSTLALIVPYPELDNRTLELIWNTRIERAKQLLDDIDKHNDKIVQDSMNAALDEAGEKTKDVWRYCMTHESKSDIPKDAFTTRFV